MLKIAICDDEGIIVEYIERLILENIKVKESAKIYKYTEPQKIQYDIENRILQDSLHRGSSAAYLSGRCADDGSRSCSHPPAGIHYQYDLHRPLHGIPLFHATYGFTAICRTQHSDDLITTAHWRMDREPVATARHTSGSRHGHLYRYGLYHRFEDTERLAGINTKEKRT